ERRLTTTPSGRSVRKGTPTDARRALASTLLAVGTPNHDRRGRRLRSAVADVAWPRGVHCRHRDAAVLGSPDALPSKRSDRRLTPDRPRLPLRVVRAVRLRGRSCLSLG